MVPAEGEREIESPNSVAVPPSILSCHTAIGPHRYTDAHGHSLPLRPATPPLLHCTTQSTPYSVEQSSRRVLELERPSPTSQATVFFFYQQSTKKHSIATISS